MVIWKTKNKNAIFGKYPCCEYINNAIRYCLHGESDLAIEELLQAILKSDGYLHSALSEEVEKVHDRVMVRNVESFKKIHRLN